MQQKHSGRPTAGFLSLTPILAAVIVVVVVGLALQASFAGPAGPSPTAGASAQGSPPPATPGLPATATPVSAPPTPTPPPLPEGLTNRTWVTLNEVEGAGYVAGTLDGRHHFVLPGGEFPLAASAGRVLSVRYGAAAPSGLVTSSTVIVRDVSTGDVIASADLPGAIASGVMGADTAYVAAPSTDKPGVVPGVAAISLADGAVSEVILPESVTADPNGPTPAPGTPLRHALVLSPSGRTLGSCIWRNGLCDVQILDLEKGSARRAVTGLAGGLWLLSDEVLVAVGDADTSGYDIATGTLLWAHEGARAESGGYILSDGSTLIQAYQDIARSERVVASVDLRSGASRELLRVPKTEPAPDLWAAASDDHSAVLIPGGQGFPGAFAGTGSFLADLLDLSTGKLERAALRVSAR